MKFFEHRSRPLAPTHVFVSRSLRYFLFATLLILGSWALGILGFHHYAAPLDWTDSIYNAAMILTGMGPALPDDAPDEAKIFASIYALFSGVVFLAATSVFIAPWVHRFFHALHVDETD